MFDHITQKFGGGPSRIDVTVNEKRAPTDDSVRLLREVQEKALATMVDRASVRNVVNGEVFLSNFSYEPQVVFAFNINGHDLTAVVRQDFRHSSKEDRINDLYERVGHAIAEVLMSAALKQGTLK